MPVECGDLPFLIKRDGTWLYRGTPINRKELVCLFSSVLRREADGSWWLQTPAERGRIEVEDAPFVAVELDWTGDGRHQVLSFRTNIDEVVTAGPEHPIRISHDLFTCEPTPYILVRPGPPGTWPSRHASIAPPTTNWSRWRCRDGSAAGACWASGARQILFPGRDAARRGVTPAALRMRLADDRRRTAVRHRRATGDYGDEVDGRLWTARRCRPRCWCRW